MASQDILINWAPQETRVAVVENAALQDLYIERTLERGQVGNVYLGKVARVLPGMQSAFVDIGLDRAAFLHVADLYDGNGGGRGDLPPVPIERRLHEGQTLTVQVVKDAIGSRPRCRKGMRSIAIATRKPRLQPSAQPTNTALTTVCTKSPPSVPRFSHNALTISAGEGNNTRGTSAATTSSCQK